MFVKMGQILANRSEILPQRFCDELRRLRSDVEPVPYEVVLRCLEEEYGLRLGRCSMRSIPIRLVAHRSRRCTALVW